MNICDGLFTKCVESDVYILLTNAS